MSGRCAGCGQVDRDARVTEEHIRYCANFAAVYAEDPDKVLAPAAEFARWKADDRQDERDVRKEGVILVADQRRADQQARWATPPDILDDEDFPERQVP